MFHFFDGRAGACPTCGEYATVCAGSSFPGTEPGSLDTGLAPTRGAPAGRRRTAGRRVIARVTVPGEYFQTFRLTLATLKWQDILVVGGGVSPEPQAATEQPDLHAGRTVAAERARQTERRFARVAELEGNDPA
jgi:hypothetical protein